MPSPPRIWLPVLPGGWRVPSALLLAMAALATGFAAVPAALADPATDLEVGQNNSWGPAVDWSATARTLQQLEVDTNRTLTSPSDGAIYGLRSRLDTTIDAETKRSLISTTVGFDASVFGGPGLQPNFNRIDPRVAVDLRYDGRRYRLESDLRFEADSTSRTQIDEAGETDEVTTQFTLAHTTDVSVVLDRRNTLRTGASFRLVEFADDIDGIVPNISGGLTAAWSHRATETTSFIFNTGFRYFEADNEANTTSQIFSFSGGIEHDRTSRHRFTAGGGLSATRTTTDDVVVGAGTAPGSTDLSLGVNAAASFDYATDGIDAGLDFSQSVQPSSQGEVQTLTRLAGNLVYPVSTYERVSATLSFTRRSAVEDDDARNILSFGPRYSYALTKDTNISLGYLFRISREDADNATGHRVFLSLSRDFTLLP